LGANSEAAVSKCADCQGSGVRVSFRQLGMMIQQMQSMCPACGGRGEVIDRKDRCQECKGHKVIQEKKVLEVFVDKGMKDGQKIVFSGVGDQQSPEIQPGDVIIVLMQDDHAVFKRDGTNLIMEKEIQLHEALCGCMFTVTHLDGRKLLIKTSKGQVIKPGDLKEIANEGMPTYKRPFDKGLLVVKFNVVFPDSVTPEQCQKLLEALPNQNGSMELDTENTEEVVLRDFDPESYRQNEHKRKEAYEEDEDGGERMGCVPQ